MPPKKAPQLDPTKYREAIRDIQPQDPLPFALIDEMTNNPPSQEFWLDKLSASENLLSQTLLFNWPVFFFFLSFNPRLDFLLSNYENHYTILIEYFLMVSEAPLYLAKLLMLYGATLEGESACVTKRGAANLQAYKTWFNSSAATKWKQAQIEKMQVDKAITDSEADSLQRHPVLLTWLNDYSTLIREEETLYRATADDALALWPEVLKLYQYNYYTYLLQFLEDINQQIENFQAHPNLLTFPELPSFPYWLNWPDTTKPLLEQLLPTYLASEKEDWVSIVHFCLTNLPHLVDKKDKTCLLSYLAMVCSLHPEVLIEPIQTHLQVVFANHPGITCLQLFKTVNSASSSTSVSSRNSTEADQSVRCRGSSVLTHPAEMMVFRLIPLCEEASASSLPAHPIYAPAPLNRGVDDWEREDESFLGSDQDDQPLVRHRKGKGT